MTCTSNLNSCRGYGFVRSGIVPQSAYAIVKYRTHRLADHSSPSGISNIPRSILMPLSSPALDISNEIPTSSFAPHREILFSGGRKLLVFPREVIIITGTIVSRKLVYDENVVNATYCVFQHGATENTESLVVCLKNTAHVYLENGMSHIVSLPFTLKSALPFDSGLLLEREINQPLSDINFSAHRFFTLVDPIGDLRVVTTSSTSVVAPGESLMYFPSKGLGSSHFLCVTFNSRQRTVNVYHVKASTRTKMTTNHGSRRKRNTSLATPNPTKIIEEELYESVQPPPLSMSISSSLNMDKKRTSTLLSGASSIARMVSESGFADQSKPNANQGSFELNSLRKDMIWTKIDTFLAKSRTSHLSISSLTYEKKEAIVVSNIASQQATVYIYKMASGSMPSFDCSVNFDCQHALSLNHPSFPGWLIVLKQDQMLQLIHPILDIESPPVQFPDAYASINCIMSTVDNKVALRSTDESRNPMCMSLILEPQNKLVLSCLKVWRHLTGSKIYESVWVLWRTALLMNEERSEWKAFVITVLSLIYPFNDATEFASSANDVTRLLPLAKSLHDSYSIDYSLRDLLPYFVVSLHLIYEETRLNAFSRGRLAEIGLLLTQMAIWMGWSDHWTTYYMIDHAFLDKSVRFLSTSLIYTPPNVYEHLVSLFENRSGSFFRLSQLVEDTDKIDKEITPRTHAILEVFSLLASSEMTASNILQALIECDSVFSDLESFPPGIRIPIKNCLSYCQKDPQFEWNEKTLNIAGRYDLCMLSSSTANDNSSPVRSLASITSRDAVHIVNSLSNKHDNTIAWDEQSEADHLKITRLIFDEDRRFYEITSLLHQTRIQTANLDISDDITEYDSTLMKREIASLVALRTLTIPFGRAALFYAGRVPLLTEKFPIPKFNLNTLIAPSMATIVLAEGSIDKHVMDWGHFHNGVSSGLSISPIATCISGSWVIFNKPAENNAQHAGFLLGLGLNGHLKSLEEWHIYNYLGPKHPLTSVGLLIGMAASMKGTMENKLTKVLSVHAVALLPQGANDLNVPMIVQSAGLIGIGLLYLETQHRRMSEILLSQLGIIRSHENAIDEEESYKLAAGIALGFINLGKGNDLRGLNDTHVVDKLLSYAISMKDAHSLHESDKSSSGSIVALGFIYMRTRNAAIASKLQIPNSEQLLDYIRPDLLLLRCLSRNIILWDNIKPTKTWIVSQIPDVLRKRHDLENLRSLDSDQINIFNVIGGACGSVAIKYASTFNEEARNVLLHYLDIIMTISAEPTENYDQRIALNSVCQLQNLLALCSSIVMAGSGDIEVLRRLRVMHGRIDKNIDYGAHMATSMALGILFLGGSQFGFCDTNFAVASLVVSLYPVFPNEGNEIEVHLQALRHFWSLSVEPRCLVIRDVKDGLPLKLPLRIGFKDGTVQSITSPTLLQHQSKIKFIEVISKEYFDVSINFQVNSDYLEQFKRSLTIFVLKKSNYELLKASVGSLLEVKDIKSGGTNTGGSAALRKLLYERLETGTSAFEKNVYLRESNQAREKHVSEVTNSGLSIFNIFDDKFELTQNAVNPVSLEDVWNLKLILAYADCKLSSDHLYLDAHFVESLRQNIWTLTH